MTLFDLLDDTPPTPRDESRPLAGELLARALRLVRTNHYLRTVPGGKTYAWMIDTAVVLISIPANHGIGRFLLGYDRPVWELARLWAPDGHPPNLLTRAVAVAVDGFRRAEPGVPCLVSYADPNQGHRGGVYRAASWAFTGVREETRRYVGPDGVPRARRSMSTYKDKRRFTMSHAETAARGWVVERCPGKLRFARGLTRAARRLLAARFPPAGGARADAEGGGQLVGGRQPDAPLGVQPAGDGRHTHPRPFRQRGG